MLNSINIDFCRDKICVNRCLKVCWRTLYILNLCLYSLLCLSMYACAPYYCIIVHTCYLSYFSVCLCPVIASSMLMLLVITSMYAMTYNCMWVSLCSLSCPQFMPMLPSMPYMLMLSIMPSTYLYALLCQWCLNIHVFVMHMFISMLKVLWKCRTTNLIRPTEEY